MKFIHIADVHLGACPDAGRAYTDTRPQELWDAFSHVIDLCEKEKIDVLLIAGDFFHRQPLMRELKEVNYLFSSLSHTKVVFIAGNHDYVKRDSYYGTFPWAENVYPLLGEHMSCTTLKELDLTVYGFSYHGREIRENRYHIKAQGKSTYEILLAHGGDENHAPISKEALAASKFHYIALGHIHKPEILIENAAAYAGSLEPVNKKDTGKHGFIRGEIGEHGTSIKFVPSAKRQYIPLALRVGKKTTNGGVKRYLKEAIDKRGVEHIYKFILRGSRDPDVEFDTAHMDIYGNIIEIVDQTSPGYDYKKLYEDNKDNLMGRFIEQFQGCTEESVEQKALEIGVQALLGNSLI